MTEDTSTRPVRREATMALLARFDRAGPRYTSYPTAVEFRDDFSVQDYEARLALADQSEAAPLSLYLHLPFCEERCLFCGCHVIITKHRGVAAPYLQFLEREMTLVAERLPHRRRFAQLHLGGGTPTYYRPEQLDRLVGSLLQLYEPIPGAECAVEVDPRVTSPEHLDVLAALGFNRLSLGVQDFTPEVQEAIHRRQSIDETARLIEHARSRGFTGINIDLIYGLPLQTPDAFERTVERVISLGVDRAAVYSFAFVPWIRGHQKRLDETTLPSPETKLRLFAIARERFIGAGFDPIGMDHFARPTDELARARREGRLRRNFQGYTVLPGDDVVGFGVSAIGDVGGAFVQNTKKLSSYEAAVSEGRLSTERGVARTRDDEIRRAVIQDLMCNFRIDLLAIEARYGIEFPEYFAPDLALLEPYRRDGLVTVHPDRIEATPTGELLVRNLAMCFDRYLRQKPPSEDRPVFSRTV